LSSEEHGPNELVWNARCAEEAGFTCALISDHYHRWTDEQGQNPFVWSVIGGIAPATERLRLGTGVTLEMLEESIDVLRTLWEGGYKTLRAISSTSTRPASTRSGPRRLVPLLRDRAAESCSRPELERKAAGVPRQGGLRADPCDLIRLMPAKGATDLERTPAWWIHVVDRFHPARFDVTASLPSFALAFGPTALAGYLERRGRPASARA
jgi:hypothetical protein